VGKPKHRGVGAYCMSKLLTENGRRKSTDIAKIKFELSKKTLYMKIENDY